MATTIAPSVQSILSTLLMELLSGQLSDETVAAVDTIERKDVPAPLSDVIGYMHGMSMQPFLRNSIISDLLIELSTGCEELAHQLKANPPAGQL